MTMTIDEYRLYGKVCSQITFPHLLNHDDDPEACLCVQREMKQTNKMCEVTTSCPPTVRVLASDSGPLSMATPFGDLWYLLSLAQLVVWRPFAMEIKHTVAIHALLGCVVGYTTVVGLCTLELI